MERHKNKYTSSSILGGAFTSDGRQDEKLDIHIGKATAIKRDFHYSVVVRRELSKKSIALNSRNSLCPFSPTVSLYGHETLVMIKRVRSQVQACKVRFLKNIEGVTLLARCTSLKIRKSLEPLFLQMKRSQLRQFGHVSRMPQEKLPNLLYLPKQMEKKIVGRPRTTVDESILH